MAGARVNYLSVDNTMLPKSPLASEKTEANQKYGKEPKNRGIYSLCLTLIRYCEVLTL